MGDVHAVFLVFVLLEPRRVEPLEGRLIHYHGTPITPINVLYELAGRHFCVSFYEPRDLNRCLSIGQSVMFDNGAFSAWKLGVEIDWKDYYAWLEPVLCGPHWAVIPDVIDGSEDDNDALIKQWPFKPFLSAPVWHLNESLGRLERLLDAWPRVCLGSSGEYATIKTKKWWARMEETFGRIVKRHAVSWIHGMRMMNLSDGPFPFSSVDSTDIARNHNRNGNNNVKKMAERWDSMQPRRQL
jgi:hypothetical protein